MATHPSPRNVNAIVEEQIHRWKLEQSKRAAERAHVVNPLPLITISRQAGSRGTELGRRVAEALGYRFWDQELVHRIAERTGAPEAVLLAVDEHPRSAIGELLTGILMGDKSTEEEYLAQLKVLFHALARHGASVVVGRGAQFVLPAESSLRVRVVGPIDTRVRTFGAEHQLADAKARADLDRVDRERLAFMRNHYHRDASDPAAYDLVVNTSSLGIDRAVDVVVAAYRAKFSERLATPG